MGHDFRRRFPGYVLAAPVLVTAAELLTAPGATALPSSGAAELQGLDDIMTAVALATSALIAIEVSQDGTVSCTVPRAPVGQAVTTSTAALIAEELAVPRRRIRVASADTGPGRVGTPAVAGTTYASVRVAAAIARQRLLRAAAAVLGVPLGGLRLDAGFVTDGAGSRLDFGALATKAASPRTLAVAVELAPRDGRPLVDHPAVGGARTAAHRRP
ncbi:molybdopterin cofactor-binding domain-containing protein [Micromonospora profundi]|uniref:molybdopterin cofactor-binding domain-containing protein n=1 Tax=Micromonospora profundi TaxID=1420889 RepID=UPI00364FDBA6